jgi:hypothetical protein
MATSLWRDFNRLPSTWGVAGARTNTSKATVWVCPARCFTAANCFSLGTDCADNSSGRASGNLLYVILLDKQSHLTCEIFAAISGAPRKTQRSTRFA